jgi:hypothetical protein
MRHPGSRRLSGGIGTLAGVLALGASSLVLSAPGPAVPASAAQVTQSGPVSSTPATGTPHLLKSTTPSGLYQAIRELQQCGSTMYAVGTFTTILQGHKTYTRDDIFSYSATAPYTMTSWAPDVNGKINSIAFAGTNCADAYIGGEFGRVDGTAVQNLAEISTTTGAVVPTFGHSASKEIDTLIVSGTHLLTGGFFTSINGSSTKYYVSLNTTTGDNDGYVNFNISGNYQYAGALGNVTHIYNQQLSHAGRRVMVEGVFTSVDGQARQQIFQEWLGPDGAQVTGWTSPDFSDHCDFLEPFYLREAAWSPEDTTVYIVTTGGYPYLWKHTYPLTGICDVVASFSADEFSENPTWISYTGCYSLYGVIADDYAVYVGGHPIWANNPDGCKSEGTGAVADPGMQGHSPSNGDVMLNSQGKALYSMSRANADYMLLTSAGLWIASTNRWGANECNGVSNLAGICFLPYSS